MSAAVLAERFRTRISPFIKQHAQSLSPEDGESILRQFTPNLVELEDAAGFSDDPLHEEDADIHPFPDVIRKYRSKILYLTTDECPVYCRYCTRKRKTLLSSGHASSSLKTIAAYLQDNPEINEVIFSGGDPLMLPAADFHERAASFLRAPTIQFLRIHTRAFTTAPGLISGKFLATLKSLRAEFPEKTIAFVLHVNTAPELSELAVAKMQAVRALEIPLFSQSVLLKNINDNPHVLAALCRSLLKIGVQPYYLHQLDRVIGSAHFEIPDGQARQIYEDLKILIPPYMLPRFVRDSKQGKYPM